MAEPIEIRVPDELEGTKSSVARWLKQVGDPVRQDEPLVELETDKAAMEVAAPTDGILAAIRLEPGQPCEPGSVLGSIAREPEPVAPAAPQEAMQADQPRSAPATSPAAVRPLPPGVRKLLRDHALDPTVIPATGRDGRLTREDVLAAIARSTQAEPAETRVNRTPHTPMRRRIAEHLSRSLSTAPHVTAIFEADFSAVMRHRDQHAGAAQRPRPTLTAYIVLASVAAMRAVPAVNSRWTEDAVERYGDINIGVATALGDEGLVVPVIQRAQDLSLPKIAARLQDLAARARAGLLKPADLQDGTFTISNHGVSGSLVAAPIIINQGQAAILGVGKLEKRVVVREIDGVDTIQIRPMAFVSLTIDHRVLDGHQANAWLTQFVKALETWPQDAAGLGNLL